jgi:uncharacterized membrane protein
MRYPLLDIIRGVSVVGMILFHANYLLEEVFARDIIPISDTLWYIIGRVVAITFIVVSGYSLFLSAERHGYLSHSYLRRTLTLALLA